MSFGTLLWDILEVKNLHVSKRGMWSIDLSQELLSITAQMEDPAQEVLKLLTARSWRNIQRKQSVCICHVLIFFFQASTVIGTIRQRTVDLESIIV